ncbi:hypothetical protein HMPREF1624_01086 [Sporothrix schenckii ATCC 58251]|uniref:Vacuolar protein 14 C-terminal Fig4-binding domain-containing protein n=1 Tax=Sporothrix schenckii (strain ATCC 58251 / de Perez 2211183) TaxID=1391915 RepID=U7Q4F9_SPOS1|nr:hypothetical protein HMPREF1624_01086 [Sporothrix schenckii ATCC 58251]
MDPSIQRALNEKLYEKRKIGALELERSIRELVAHKDTATVEAILDQLCNEYAYTVHQHSRNGGLIGLAAAAIALGSELPRYLETIVPPVLACFVDQDARVRYYACEAMYNIAKVAKGEILIYFNHIFDALCKLGADSELSVKNGAELLDRLVKDIVSESAATPDSSTIATNAPASVLWNGSVGSKGNDGSGADGDDADDGEEAEDDDYHNNDADEPDVDSEDDWVPGQDVHIHYGAILEILTDTLDSPQGMLNGSSMDFVKQLPHLPLTLIVLTFFVFET